MVSQQQWSEIASDFWKWRRGVLGINAQTALVSLGSVVALGFVFTYAEGLASALAGESLWWQIGAGFGLLIASPFLAQGLRYFFGSFEWQSYRDGFTEGVTAGVNRSLDLSDKEATEIREIAQDIELDSRLIRLFDENPVRE